MFAALKSRLGFGDSPHRRARLLHDAARDAAFRPVWYTEFGVQDTVDGRFDMLCCMLWLAADRITGPGGPGRDQLAGLIEAFVTELDAGLREAGESDQTVGRKVQSMTGAFYGRMKAYGDALSQPVPGDALAAALLRNVWRGAAVDPARARHLADALLELRAWLAGQDMDSLTERAGAQWALPGDKMGVAGP